ncbi:MAG: hypothetical protein H0U63_04195 [Burkholderiales bacterium]|nr:hypothetical protein [Burkholderiales bacterium]
MKTNTLIKSAIVVSVSIGALALAGCEVKKTQEGVAPKVEVKDGQLPKYDVKTPEVVVGTEKKEIRVPTDIDVKTEKKEITVPKVDVTPASEANKK